MPLLQNEPLAEHQSQKLSDHPRVVALEFVRVIATATVFLCHCLSLPGVADFLGKSRFALVYGREAVIVFFVLSGVVNRIAVDRSRPTGKQLLVSRARRLLPQYYTVAIITFVLGMMILNDFAIDRLIGHIVFLTTLQGDIISPLPLNAALWTMSFECVFYLMLAAQLSCTHAWTRMIWPAVGVAAVIIHELDLTPGLITWCCKMLGYSVVWLLGYYASDLSKWVQFRTCDIAVLMGSIPALTNLGLRLERPLWYVVTGFLVLPLFIRILSSHSRTVRYPSPGITTFLASSVTTGILTVLVLSGQPRVRTAVLVFAVLGCVLFAGLIETASKWLTARYPRVIALMGKATFEFYLLHMLIIEIMTRWEVTWPTNFVAAAISTLLLTGLLESFFRRRMPRQISVA